MPWWLGCSWQKVFLPTSIRLHSQNVFRDATNKCKGVTNAIAHSCYVDPERDRKTHRRLTGSFRRFLGSQIRTDPTPPPQLRIFIAAVPPRPVVQLMMRKDAEANIEVSERKAGGHTRRCFHRKLLRRYEAIAKRVLDVVMAV